LPSTLRYLWITFQRLANRRASNGFGLNPISWADIDAFLRLTRLRLTPWEIEQIEMLDNLYRVEHSQNGPDTE